MVGFGSFVGGGATPLSSSYLSASAQPFTVDRNNSSAGAFSYDSSLGNFTNPNWSPQLDYQLGVGPSAPLATDYSFGYGTENYCSMNPSSKSTSHPISVDWQREPYYPSGYYSDVPPPINEAVPFITPTESRYETIYSSGLVSAPADVSSLADYTQCSSGLAYPTQLRGIGSELGDDDHGGDDIECGNVLGKGSSISHRLLSDSSGGQICSDWMSVEHANSSAFFNGEDYSFPFNSKSRILSSEPIVPESIPIGQSGQSSVDSMNYQILFNAYENRIQQFDSCRFGSQSVTKSPPPASVVSTSPVDAASAPCKTAFSKSVGVIGVSSYYQNDKNNLLKEKESLVELVPKGEECSFSGKQLKFRKVDREETYASVLLKEPSSMSHSEGTLNNVFRINAGTQVVESPVSASFPLPSCGCEAIHPPVNFSDFLEHINTRVDSPCWKGAPASHSSPFDAVKIERDDDCTDLECGCVECKVKDETFSLLADPVRSLVEEVDEEQVQDKRLCTSRERRSIDAVESRFKAPILMHDKSVQYCEESSEPGEKESISGVQRIKELGVEINDCSTTRANIQAAVLDSLVNLCDTIESCAVAAENVLHSSSVEERKINSPKPQKGGSAPRLDVQTLINALKNISDLLMHNFSSDSCPLKEQHSEAINDVIRNLNTLVSDKRVHMAHSPAPGVHNLDTSDKVGESAIPVMGIDESTSQVLQYASVDSHVQSLKETRNYNHYGEKEQSFQQFDQLRDNFNFSGVDKISQSMRKVLDENFCGGEETQSQALLFKNLWLNAEAELCSIHLRTRFDRVKNELEKFRPNQRNDISDNAALWEKSSNVKDPQNLGASDMMMTSACNGSLQKRVMASCPSSVDDGEASVMARLRVLKCRDDFKPMNSAGEHSCPAPSVCAGDSGNQSSEHNGQKHQFSDGSSHSITNSSDWEHVVM